MIELREYQTNLINGVKKELLAGKKSVCVVLGCGGGKSIIQGMIAKSATDKGNRVLFLVHRKELCQQIHNTFDMCGVDFNLCTIGMVQTLTRHIEKIDEPSIIITDEAHHCLANSYLNIYRSFPDAIRLGFTATPTRLNDGGLGAVFETMVEGVSTKWLIANHYLAPFKYKGFQLVDTSKLHIRAGEYKNEEVNELMSSRVIYGDAVKTWMDIASDRKTIVYCDSIEHSKMVIDEFKSQGIKAEHLDGTTDKTTREAVMQQFRDSEIQVLSNVDLFGEGIDVPDCNCVIMLRPTASVSLFIQQSMRCMRYKPNKDALIIDHVNNYVKHGLPDSNREWTLESKAKGKREKNEVRGVVCPECLTVFDPNDTNVCPVCGWEREVKKQETVVEKQVEMIDVSELYAQIDDPQFIKLVETQKKRGYKPGWILYQLHKMGKFDEPHLRFLQIYFRYKPGWVWYQLQNGGKYDRTRHSDEY